MAAEMAIQSPLLDNISVEGARGVLINIVGGPDLKLKEMEEAARLIEEQAHEDAEIIWGASIDEAMGEMVKVTVIATGFDREAAPLEAARSQSSMRPAVPAVSQSFAPPTRAVPSVQPQQVPRSMPREEVGHAVSRRAGTGMFASGAQQGLPIQPSRERTTMMSAADFELDTPTFQRKGQ
jgi:cell division protein FtsZ